MEGYKIIRYTSLDSTNTEAVRKFKELPEKTIITSERQTDGKGRFERVWRSEGKGLYFTAVVKFGEYRPFFPAATLIMALCICKVLGRHGIKASIKWPNDILCGGKKLCGILALTAGDNNTVRGMAIGAGVNMTQTAEDFGAGLRRPAVSLAMLGLSIEKEKLLKEIAEDFFKTFDIFREKGFKRFKDDYSSFADFLGKEVKITVLDSTVRGTADGINDDGTLRLRTVAGTLRNISAGDMD